MEYDLLLQKIMKLLSKTNYVVLATASKDGIVTASKMCVISDGTTLYFQTDSNFEKARNIMENPNVAITIENIYFKGQAIITGHPSQNQFFVEKMKERHYQTYENYTNLHNQILIKVNLTECRIWGIWQNNDIGDDSVVREESIKILNLKNEQLTKIKCDNIKGGY